jgi:4-hydroxyphenylpyruvate dioxygenase-like putative hemolysin
LFAGQCRVIETISTTNNVHSHVHGFLQEIGQGVQHVASRVGDIVTFVQQANDRRKIFGEVRVACHLF